MYAGPIARACVVRSGRQLLASSMGTHLKLRMSLPQRCRLGSVCGEYVDDDFVYFRDARLGSITLSALASRISWVTGACRQSVSRTMLSLVSAHSATQATARTSLTSVWVASPLAVSRTHSSLRTIRCQTADGARKPDSRPPLRVRTQAR